MWMSTREESDWLDALNAGSNSDAAAELYRWSVTASVVVEEWKAIGKAVDAVKSSYAADELDIAVTCLAGVAADLDSLRRHFAALAEEGDQ